MTIMGRNVGKIRRTPVLILRLELPGRRLKASPKRTFMDVVNKDMKIIDPREGAVVR